MDPELSARFSRVMLVDDSSIDNFINKLIMEKICFAKEVVVKQSATNALEYLQSLENQIALKPEVIFLDIRMPEIDGFEFLRRYDLLPEKVKEKVKIVMLSSSLDENDLNQANENKYVCKFMNKPLSKEELLSLPN